MVFQRIDVDHLCCFREAALFLIAKQNQREMTALKHNDSYAYKSLERQFFKKFGVRFKLVFVFQIFCQHADFFQYYKAFR